MGGATHPAPGSDAGHKGVLDRSQDKTMSPAVCPETGLPSLSLASNPSGWKSLTLASQRPSHGAHERRLGRHSVKEKAHVLGGSPVILTPYSVYFLQFYPGQKLFPENHASVRTPQGKGGH